MSEHGRRGLEPDVVLAGKYLSALYPIFILTVAQSARHIKCDETPVTCRNCTSTGRWCDGYDAQRLPHKWKGGTSKNNTVPQSGPGKVVSWAMTSDERLCFSYFHGHTIPTLLQSFDSTLWQKLVPQLTRYEPAVYHAIVALSAIHRSSENNGMQLATPASFKAQDTWHQFAQDQLGRSITLLNQRCGSQDPYLRDVILVCCLLFVLADLLRGRYEDAFNHLRSGLCILKELQVSNACSIQALVEQYLVSAFTHLDILASHYDRVFPIFSSDNQPGPTQSISHGIPDSGPHFRSLPEVRIAFDSLLRSFYRFSSRCLGMSDVEIALNYETLQVQQLEVWSQVVQFKQFFEPFYKHFYDGLDPKAQRGLDIVRLHMLSSPVCLKSLLLGSNRAPLAYYTPDLEAVCALTEAIMTKFPERPSVTVENGVVAPLFHAATLCCEYSIRWWALELLQSWPHREGPFDSNWVAFLSEETLRLELEARCDEDPGFRETVFVLRGEELSIHQMLTKITHSQRQQLDGLRRAGHIKGAPEEPPSDFLSTFSEIKGMQRWSCVRAFTAATSRTKENLHIYIQ